MQLAQILVQLHTVTNQALESKHRVIRDVFIRLNASNPKYVDKKFLALQAVRIGNNRYGNDIALSNELTKGYFIC